MDLEHFQNGFHRYRKIYAKHSIYDINYLISFFILFYSLIACTHVKTGLSAKSKAETDPVKISQARMILSALESQNADLKNFKGIGKIKLWKNGRIHIDERIAWVGSKPVNISIAVLISGYPAVKIATDGKWLYYLEAHGDQPIYKKIPSQNASLEQIISIPIPAQDIITLLAGRIPIREHHSAFTRENDSGKGPVVVLKKYWWGIVEKIYIEETSRQVSQLEFFNRSGTMVYRVILESITDIEGYRVPFKLKITNGDGIDFELDIQRYWANVSTTPSMFVLTPPGD
jgi:hypothetical protein